MLQRFQFLRNAAKILVEDDKYSFFFSQLGLLRIELFNAQHQLVASKDNA